MSLENFTHRRNNGIVQVQEELLLVKNWMTPSPYCVQEGQTLKESAEMMLELKVDGLPIVDNRGYFVGMMTLRKALHQLMNDHKENKHLANIPTRNSAIVHPTDSILDVFSLPYDQLPVVDECGKPIGILTKRDMLDGFSRYINWLKQKHNTAEALSIILESAYEGIAVVDENGVLQEFNEAYSRFTGITREEAIGKHVTEVIDNTNLHMTIKSAIPERGVLQNIQGQDMVVHRIPIWKEDKVVGAIGMLIFEGVTEVYKLYERIQEDHLKDKVTDKPLPTEKVYDSRLTLDQIIGMSEELANVKRLARRAARTAATVLITGESGTGKEIFAKSIHHLSPFATGPFISVNCGAIPDHLFESELFGYEEGAFTGAKKGGKPGKFELADNGTIFLDEIGEMPLVMQTKLLRVLQEKEAERVGGLKKYVINARIVTATNRNLRDMVQKGEFREDLYYRLNIIQLHIPPLRERRQDIPLLISHYVNGVCKKYGMKEKSFTKEAVSAIMNNEWRGNIRELVNTIEQLVTLVDGEVINVQHLSGTINTGNSNSPRLRTEEPFTTSTSMIHEAKMHGIEREKEYIIQSLKTAGGNKSKAAELLGVHRTTLYQKLKKYGIK